MKKYNKKGKIITVIIYVIDVVFGLPVLLSFLFAINPSSTFGKTYFYSEIMTGIGFVGAFIWGILYLILRGIRLSSGIALIESAVEVETNDEHIKSNITKPETVNEKVALTDNTLWGYIIKNKKNILLSGFSVLILKVLIHCFIYPITKRDKIQGGYNLDGNLRRKIGGYDVPAKYSERYRVDFGEHISNIFELEVWLFIPSIIIVSFVAWYFNDKIKAK